MSWVLPFLGHRNKTTSKGPSLSPPEGSQGGTESPNGENFLSPFLQGMIPTTYSWHFLPLFLAICLMSSLSASTRKGVRGLSCHSLWFQKVAFTSVQAGRDGSSSSLRDLWGVDERWEGDSVLTVCSLLSWGPRSPSYWYFVQTGHSWDPFWSRTTWRIPRQKLWELWGLG